MGIEPAVYMASDVKPMGLINSLVTINIKCLNMWVKRISNRICTT
jgi:hypothetical protein